jgi:polysaccharide pyruvyl transferase WcaK-like protein
VTNDTPGDDFYFDEEWYLKRYPDVKRAIDAGHQKSALSHYLTSGKAEGREPFGFDEEWYLNRNPDVVASVSAGRCASALEHFLAHGRREGRRPVPPVVVSATPVYAYGAYGTNNVGDEAIFQGILEEFGDVIQIFHQRPSHNNAISIGDAVLYTGLFKPGGLLIIGGGGLLYGKEAVETLIQLARNAKARETNVDLLGLGCEAAHEDFFAEIRLLDSLVRNVSVRTRRSAEIYQAITGRMPEVRPDFAMNLSRKIGLPARRQERKVPLVGIVTSGDIRDDLRPLIDAMVSNGRGPIGERVNFVHIPHSQSYIDRCNNDVIVGQALRCDFWKAANEGEIQNESKLSVLPYQNDPMEVLKFYSELDGLISARFHGIVFAEIIGLPTLVLPAVPAAAEKNEAFIRDYCGDRVLLCESPRDIAKLLPKLVEKLSSVARSANGQRLA